jgi:hypothetical protein
MKKQFLLAAFCLTGLAFIYSSCKKDSTDSFSSNTNPTPNPSLYTRVGGTEMTADPTHPGQMIEKGRLTLRAVVDSSILVIAGDTQLAKYFPVLFGELGNGNTTGLNALSKNFTDFMCSATGATNTSYAYTGKSMKDAHDPAKNNRIALKINSEDFDKFVGDIGTGLAKNGVTAQNNKQLVDDLVALLYTTKADIVQR